LNTDTDIVHVVRKRSSCSLVLSLVPIADDTWSIIDQCAVGERCQRSLHLLRTLKKRI